MALTRINNQAMTNVTSSGIPALDSDNLPSGTVLQTVSSTKTDTQSIGTTWSFTKVSGLTVNITPKKANSKFLITAHIVTGGSYFSYGFKIYKDGSELSDFKADTLGNRTSLAFGALVYDQNNGNEDHDVRTCSGEYLYSSSAPASTQISFDVHGSPYSSGLPLYINRNANDADSSSRIRTSSTLTVTEIAG